MCTDTVTKGDNAEVLFEGNHADRLGGAIVILGSIVLAGSVYQQYSSIWRSHFSGSRPI